MNIPENLNGYIKSSIERAGSFFEVSKKEFESISSNYCADKIAYSQKVPVYLFRKMYCITTGGMSPAQFIYQVKQIDHYHGTLEPLEYGEHWRAVDSGHRERCYQGMLIKSSKGSLVVCSKQMVVLQSSIEEQLSMF